MANKRILRLTNTEALVKFDGSPGSVTLNLATDLKLPTEDIVGTPTVNITFMAVSGKLDSTVSISRGGVNLWDLQSNASTYLNLLDIGGTSDSTNNTADIVATISGAEGQLVMKVRKVSGYKTKIRSAENGTDAPL